MYLEIGLVYTSNMLLIAKSSNLTGMWLTTQIKDVDRIQTWLKQHTRTKGIPFEQNMSNIKM